MAAKQDMCSCGELKDIRAKRCRKCYTISPDFGWKNSLKSRHKLSKSLSKNRQKHSAGYWTIRIKGKHPRACKYDKFGNSYIYEHLLVVEKTLGRPLLRSEVVHHINGNKSDNRNRNLLVCDSSYHSWIHWRMSDLYMKEKFGGNIESNTTCS